MKVSKSQLARIHIAKKDLCLDDTVYRQILINETGKKSAALLSYGQAKTVIEYFEAAGWKPNGRHEARGERREYRKRDGFASPRQVGMIKGLWAELSYAPKERRDGALREFMHKKFGVSDLRFLSSEGAPKVINALLAMRGQARGVRK